MAARAGSVGLRRFVLQRICLFFPKPPLCKTGTLANLNGFRATLLARGGSSVLLTGTQRLAKAETYRTISVASRESGVAFATSRSYATNPLSGSLKLGVPSNVATTLRNVGFTVRAASTIGAKYTKDPTATASGKILLRHVPVPVSIDSPDVRRESVLELVRSQVKHHKDAFYVVDLAEVAHKLNEWYSQLPRVRPYYAVKCNDDPNIVKTLSALGAGFDCATKGEIAMVLACGVQAEDIIFAHPAKQPSHIQYAATKGVAKMTFDNEDELRKIAREHPGAEAVLRLLTDDSHSVCRLGLKFGAPISTVRHLLKVAKEVNVAVIGLSYHVGSGNGNAASFADAVVLAREAFDIAQDVGMPFRVLDIGGGFPGSELGADILTGQKAVNTRLADGDNPYSKHPSFKVIASHVRAALDTHFPPGCGVQLIAEPGRYFAKSTHTLAVNVVGKRVTSDEGNGSAPRFNYYVNDGLYGSFNCILYDHVTMAPDRLLALDGREMDLALLAQAREALAASGSGGDDSVARLDADGTAVVQDAVGLGEAVQLAATVAQEQEEVQMKRMVMGGPEDAEEATTTTLSSRRPSFSTVSSPSARGGAGGVSPSSALSASLPQVHATTLWGPTCDSMDKISDSAPLPELFTGDWLVFENAGAYTIAGSCKFNGFPLSSKVYVHLDGRLEVQEEEAHA